MRNLILGALLVFIPSLAKADTVFLKGGGKMDCLIVQDRPESVAFMYGSGLFRVSRTMVERVEKSPPAVAKPTSGQKGDGEMLPNWLSVLKAFASEPWSAELAQVPATVIDEGVMKNVPYKSQRCGQYEFNVYGDPDQPAGFELGMYGYRIHDDDSKLACVEAVAKLVKSEEVRTALRSLKLAGESKTVRGITVEITPATAKDAYGGWWVSVYSEELLDKSRASATELTEISTSVTPDKPGATGSGARATPAKPADSVDKQPQEPVSPPPIRTEWAASDMKYARPASVPSSGRVYVRAYVRKDGTYVAGHSRKTPRK